MNWYKLSQKQPQEFIWNIRFKIDAEMVLICKAHKSRYVARCVLTELDSPWTNTEEINHNEKIVANVEIDPEFVLNDLNKGVSINTTIVSNCGTLEPLYILPSEYENKVLNKVLHSPAEFIEGKYSSGRSIAEILLCPMT